MLAALVVAVAMAVPLAYIVVRAAGGDPETWRRLVSREVPALLASTVALVVLTTSGALVVGTGLAWLVERTDLPGVRWLRPLAAVPLAIPPYAGAICYLQLLRPSGAIDAALEGTPFAGWPLPRPFGLAGASVVLVLFTYPYVYLLVAAALRDTNRVWDDLARVAGHGRRGLLRHVTLPLLRPALGAAAVLVSLYALSDYGAVALTRYRTFSYAVFQQVQGQVDRSGAAALSGVLVLMTLAVIAFEARVGREGRYAQRTPGWRPARPVPLGRWRLPALGFVGAVLGLAVGVPFVVLGAWALSNAFAPPDATAAWLMPAGRVAGAALNTLWTSAAAASLGVLAALPVAYLVVRHPGSPSSALMALSQSGYAMPGVVMALSLVALFNRGLPALYGTVGVVVAAYTARFLPQAIQALRTGFEGLAPSLGDAGRTLGLGPWAVLRRIDLPLMLPGLTAGWSLVFLSSLKELPATLILRPPGFDTLPTAIWTSASEAVYRAAALPALVLIVVALVPLAVLLRRGELGTGSL